MQEILGFVSPGGFGAWNPLLKDEGQPAFSGDSPVDAGESRIANDAGKARLRNSTGREKTLRRDLKCHGTTLQAGAV